MFSVFLLKTKNIDDECCHIFFTHYMDHLREAEGEPRDVRMAKECEDKPGVVRMSQGACE